MYQQKALHVCINCVPYQSSLDYILETTTRCIHRSILLVIDSRSMNIQLYVVCLCVPTTSSYYLLLCERNSVFEVEKEVSNKIPFWKVFRRQKETNLAFFFIGLIKITKHNATYTFFFFLRYKITTEIDFKTAVNHSWNLEASDDGRLHALKMSLWQTSQTAETWVSSSRTEKKDCYRVLVFKKRNQVSS